MSPHRNFILGSLGVIIAWVGFGVWSLLTWIFDHRPANLSGCSRWLVWERKMRRARREIWRCRCTVGKSCRRLAGYTCNKVSPR